MDIIYVVITMQPVSPVYPCLSLLVRTMEIGHLELVMPVAKKGGHMTGLANVTAMSDILVESGADGVTYPFRASARSHFEDAGNRERFHKVESSQVITVQFPSLAKYTMTIERP